VAPMLHVEALLSVYGLSMITHSELAYAAAVVREVHLTTFVRAKPGDRRAAPSGAPRMRWR
jgi:hypothetical protein